MGKGKILYVVKVRQILRRWSTRASLRRGWRAPADVPAGHVAICVGSSGRRFVVRAANLNHPVFRKLLTEAEEEYGFSARAGPIAVPCDESRFEEILRQISSSSSSATSFENLDVLKGCFSFFHVGIRSSSNTEPSSATSFANLDDLKGCFSSFHVGNRSSSNTESLPLLPRFNETSVW